MRCMPRQTFQNCWILPHRQFSIRDGSSCWTIPAVYSFENEGVLRDNQRHALNDDPLIQKFFAAAENRVALINSVPGGSDID